MKRALALMLLAVLLTGCGRKAPAPTAATGPAQTAPVTTAPSTTAPVLPAPAPLELLETVWNALPEENRFPSFGGDMTDEIQEGPGAYDLSSTDALAYTLLVPEEQLPNVKEAASLIHMMNANTFTCGTFRLEGVSAADFTEAMDERIASNQWMCGFPERMVIASFGDDTVLTAFGQEDALNPFLDQLTRTYSGQMVILVDEPIV